jgi:hypothetical protein
MPPKRVKWKTIQCSTCGGHGMVARYSCNDFEGAEECGDCGGKGHIYQSDKGVLAEYPGGPFIGRISLAPNTMT